MGRYCSYHSCYVWYTVRWILIFTSDIFLLGLRLFWSIGISIDTSNYGIGYTIYQNIDDIVTIYCFKSGFRNFKNAIIMIFNIQYRAVLIHTVFSNRENWTCELWRCMLKSISCTGLPAPRMRINCKCILVYGATNFILNWQYLFTYCFALRYWAW